MMNMDEEVLDKIIEHLMRSRGSRLMKKKDPLLESGEVERLDNPEAIKMQSLEVIPGEGLEDESENEGIDEVSDTDNIESMDDSIEHDPLDDEIMGDEIGPETYLEGEDLSEEELEELLRELEGI